MVLFGIFMKKSIKGAKKGRVNNGFVMGLIEREKFHKMFIEKVVQKFVHSLKAFYVTGILE